MHGIFHEISGKCRNSILIVHSLCMLERSLFVSLGFIWVFLPVCWFFVLVGFWWGFIWCFVLFWFFCFLVWFWGFFEGCFLFLFFLGGGRACVRLVGVFLHKIIFNSTFCEYGGPIMSFHNPSIIYIALNRSLTQRCHQALPQLTPTL